MDVPLVSLLCRCKAQKVCFLAQAGDPSAASGVAVHELVQIAPMQEADFANEVIDRSNSSCERLPQPRNACAVHAALMCIKTFSLDGTRDATIGTNDLPATSEPNAPLDGTMAEDKQSAAEGGSVSDSNDSDEEASGESDTGATCAWCRHSCRADRRQVVCLPVKVAQRLCKMLRPTFQSCLAETTVEDAPSTSDVLDQSGTLQQLQCRWSRRHATRSRWQMCGTGPR